MEVLFVTFKQITKAYRRCIDSHKSGLISSNAFDSCQLYALRMEGAASSAGRRQTIRERWTRRLLLLCRGPHHVRVFHTYVIRVCVCGGVDRLLIRLKVITTEMLFQSTCAQSTWTLYRNKQGGVIESIISSSLPKRIQISIPHHHHPFSSHHSATLSWLYHRRSLQPLSDITSRTVSLLASLILHSQPVGSKKKRSFICGF